MRHILGRAVIYAYMCMKENEYCSTVIVPTPLGRRLGTWSSLTPSFWNICLMS